ncbi:hypothetical protein OIV83_002912 [Microbotryomycetes sp. JL201]|nr:hypothetical protein OIV83_002912 [Microbotryomycetes sp. JL201]
MTDLHAHSDGNNSQSDLEKHDSPPPVTKAQDGTKVALYGAEVASQESLARKEGVSAAFLAKCKVLNTAMSEIGMGRYQWYLFLSAGFGWFSDNIWLQGIAIIMPQVAVETGWVDYPNVRMATFALYCGLIVGATFFGMSADIVGRRLAWNATLFIGAIFGICAGAAPNYVVFCTFIALTGFGVGGNLPVDGALYLEFIPNSHNWTLTLLSVWWAVGQVVASLICWAFIAKYSCDSARAKADAAAGVLDPYTCDWSTNAGWRYSYFTLGGLMLFLSVLRMFVFPMHESPKFLASMGRDQDAVDVIHAVAMYNGKTSSLTAEDLRRAARPYLEGQEKDVTTKFSTMELVKNSFSEFSGEHIKGLFATKRLAWSTTLICVIYGALGIAYPLFNGFLTGYLQAKNASFGDTSIDATYGGYTYQAACGVIGSILACGLVQWRRGGRKFAMAFFTVGAGCFLFGLTAARNSRTINALTCMAALFENAFYGIVYSYAPETFPTPHRGTGDALASATSRVTGLFAPIIAVYSSAAKTPDGPVFASASIFVATGVLMMFLPVETRGRDAL